MAKKNVKKPNSSSRLSNVMGGKQTMPTTKGHVFELAKHGHMTLLDLFDHAGRLSEEGQIEQAINLYNVWLENTTSPAAYAVYFNLGVSLAQVGNDVAAEQAYRQAIELKFDFNPARFNLGTVLERQGKYDDALAQWHLILQYADLNILDDKSLYIQALNNLGRLMEHTKRLQEAEQMLARSLEQKPDQPDVISHWVHLRQKQCEWPVYDTRIGVSEFELKHATSALAMLSASDDPASQLATAQHFVKSKVVSSVEPLSNRQGYRHDKLRVGYLSSDFCMHAVAILTAELYELHDRSKIEVYGFCWSIEDGSAMRARILRAMDHYVSIKEMSDEVAAKVIRSHEIDILVDLQGLTSGTRPNILAYRPAPIQLTYLGFPGTTALSAIDYVISDRYVFPESLAPFFTEKPLYMPNCFQINDRQRRIGSRPSRAECGLPDSGFVFCSFNNNYKFTPEVFACWMRILHQVSDSVLWLLADNEWARENLFHAALQYGIEPARIIFAPRVSPESYLARYQVADLFLDTYPFNAGTTASDALWAGLPVLTYSGRTFASRMAGSLLHAVGLPELVSDSLHEYEEKAVELGRSQTRIDAMKQHLQAVRLSCPLFDSPRFVKDLEDLYMELAGREHLEHGDTNTAGYAHMRLPKLSPADPENVVNLFAPMVWGLSDPVRFYGLMTEAVQYVVPGYYLGDNLFTWGKNNSLFDDIDFRRSWESNLQNDADRAIAWRRYILVCAAYHCSQLPGDFVECGVYKGTAIKTVIDYFGQDGFCKNFWGYDTFDYNPTEHNPFVGQEDGLFNEVKKRFLNYPQVRLVQGLLPDSLENNSPAEIAYLHIDLNSSKYEVAVLDVLFDRVVAGGIVILDDYEWAMRYRSQKLAEDVWFDKRGYRVFPLPTGQGLVLKR